MLSPLWSFRSNNSSHSSVVTWRNQKICQHQKLILSEFLLVFLPIIMVSSTEVRHHFLYCCLHKPKKPHTISEVHLILKNVFLNCYISSSIYKLLFLFPHPLFLYQKNNINYSLPKTNASIRSFLAL